MTTPFEREYGKAKWQRWSYASGQFDTLKNASPPIPPRHGVYIIRAPELIERLRGKSDVLYIGQAGGGPRGGRQGIGKGNGGPGRLFNTRGQDRWVREKAESKYLNGQFSLECFFIDSADPKEYETALLRAYLETHYELPPANHQSGIERETPNQAL